jgi:hypothetical protein
MNISFGWTAQYLPPHGVKSVTRRIWKPKTLSIWQKAYDENRRLHGAWNKSTFAPGAKRIGEIYLLQRPYLEALTDMEPSDVIHEGGMVDSVAEFAAKYFKGDLSQEVVVVRFRFTPTTEFASHEFKQEAA